MRAAATLLAVLLSACGWPAASTSAGPPRAVTEALTRGVNLSIWFTYRGAEGIDPALFHPDAADFRLIRQTGLRSLRVQFDPAWLLDGSGRLRPAHVDELRRELEMAAAEGLLTVLAMQPSSESKQRLAADDAALGAAAEVWKALAQQLSTVGPEHLVFEPLNEPEIEDPVRVRVILQRLSAAIRSAAPRHTLVLAGPKFSDAADLVKMQPLEDLNVVYSFHFYEPHNFTHQGAGWGWPMWLRFRDWPYPSSPEAVAGLLPGVASDVREHLAWYGEQRWDRAKLAAALQPVTAWARRHQVSLWCSEFGVMRQVQPAHRAAWLRDTRELLEQNGIAWSVWDYAGHFGLVSGPQGQRVLDRDAAAALGLRTAD